MDEEKEHVEMDEEQMDKDEMDKEQIDEEEMDEEEMDEEEEHVEMDDRGRMKDLAPVSHWQGKREREGHLLQFPAEHNCASTYIQHNLPSTYTNRTILLPHYIHPSALAIVVRLKVQLTLNLPQYPAINARSCALHVLLKSNPTATSPGTGAVR